MSRQFGLARAFADEMSRLNVQMSVTSLMRCELPLMMAPALSRVAEMSWLTKRTVIEAMPLFTSDSEDVGLVDADEALVDLLLAALAIGDGAREPLVHVAAEEILQELAIAFGERGDDHLVRLLGATDERVGIERGVEARDVDETVACGGLDARIGLDALLGIRLRLFGGHWGGAVALAARHGDHIVG